jgi:hypothetical protein
MQKRLTTKGVKGKNLEDAYRLMAHDGASETTALEWAEDTAGEAADKTLYGWCRKKVGPERRGGRKGR